jgi:hypothetical protein
MFDLQNTPDAVVPAPASAPVAVPAPALDLSNLGLDDDLIPPAPSPEPAPPPVADRVPIYDTRHTDAGGRQRGSVYYDVEELVKGAQEKEALADRATRWAQRATEEKERMERLVHQYQTQGFDRREATAMAARTPIPTPTPETAKFRLPPEVIEAFADETVAGKLESAVEEYVAARTSAQPRVEPAELIPLVVQQLDAREKQNKLYSDLDTLTRTHSADYPPLDIATAALKDPESPEYERAMQLNRVCILAEVLGSVEEAHRYVSFERGKLDTENTIQQAREEGRKEGEAALLKRWREGGARLVPQSPVPGATTVPTPDEIANYTPEQMLQWRRQQARRLDLSKVASEL